MKNFFATLNKISIQMASHLCFNRSHASLYEYIRAASVGWRKLSVTITLDSMLQSNIKLQLPRVPISRASLYEARANLIDLQVLLVKDNVYCLNFPLILRVLCYTYGEEFKYSPEYYDEINNIYAEVSKRLIDNQLIPEVSPLPTCEEIFSKLPQKTKSKRTLAIVPIDVKLTPMSLFNRFVKIFKDQGVSVFPTLMEADPSTMNVEIGCLKGLINKYKGREDLLFRFLQEAALYWAYICKEAEKQNLYQFIFGHADIIVLYQHHDFILSSLERNPNLLREGTNAEH